MGFYWASIGGSFGGSFGVLLGFYWGFYWGFIGVLLGSIGFCWGSIGVLLGFCWGSIGFYRGSGFKRFRFKVLGFELIGTRARARTVPSKLYGNMLPAASLLGDCQRMGAHPNQSASSMPQVR